MKAVKGIGAGMVVLAVLAMSSGASAQVVQEEDFELKQSRQRVHMPGLRLDYGFSEVIGLGVGYMYATEAIFGFAGVETLFRAGAGADLSVVVPSDWGGLEAVTVYGRGRLSGVGPSGGLTLEAGLGAGVERRGVVPGATLGAYYAGKQFEIGYFYQFALQSYRPDWMSTHNVGLRLHIPLLPH
ncbi:hypothetical protein DL240_14060 [Lujinxingia litoralis]|uniref:Outer membrane protein beta-barrel domain-containing protein n=1 Tax=Lujinxingia litoralis TaxID=2211119 RepID=A0A328C5H3_9DELT|nr:hypothetical protein [Lujinxingia litoralis]RAL21246.1 hypothetical protein DL240_14060 [Lujinxingia litoralis]